MGNDNWPAAGEGGGGWKPDVTTAAGNHGWQPEPSDDGGVFTGFSAENTSKHDGFADDGARDGGCRVCGAEGHFARDCPDKPVNSGECYNCGEIGHNKADCPNPYLERAFTGNCNLCSEPGHRAKDCPSKPPPTCKICKAEDHVTTECTVNRMFVAAKEEVLDPKEAWKALVTADKAKEVEAIRKALLAYAQAEPDATFQEIEKHFRDSKMNTYLIAKEKNGSEPHTLVNLQGKTDQKFSIGVNFSQEPRRQIFATGWPASPEENMERLCESGFPMDKMVDKCYNCSQFGHTSRACPEGKQEKVQPVVTCSNCDQEGHRTRDCREPRKQSGRDCRHCGEVGHMAKDCPNKEPEVCRNCGEEGHISKECEKEHVMKCRNCDAEGHAARDCPLPKDMTRIQCRNCDQMGHTSRECPLPTDWSRVECSNCHEKGHSYKRCQKQAADNEENGSGGGWGNGDAKGADAGAGNGDGGWGNNNAASTGGW